jgi:hypothetical protein
VADEPELLYLDPASEAEADTLQAIIHEEIWARVAIEGNVSSIEQVTKLSGVIADALLDSYEVRRRPAERPRTKWVRQDDAGA